LLDDEPLSEGHRITAAPTTPPQAVPPVAALTDPAAEAAIGAACHTLHLPCGVPKLSTIR